jgi:hypothetical protein
MATFLDVGLLQTLSLVFPFLLVLVFSFAVMNKWGGPFKDKPALSAIVAFVLAVFTAVSPIATKTISLMAPYVVIIIIFALFVLVAYQSFGIKEETIIQTLTGEEYGPVFGYTLIIILLLIAIGSLVTVVSEKGILTIEGTQTEELGLIKILQHPKILGMALILLIGTFTINQLTKSD